VGGALGGEGGSRAGLGIGQEFGFELMRTGLDEESAVRCGVVVGRFDLHRRGWLSLTTTEETSEQQTESAQERTLHTAELRSFMVSGGNDRFATLQMPGGETRGCGCAVFKTLSGTLICANSEQVWISDD